MTTTVQMTKRRKHALRLSDWAVIGVKATFFSVAAVLTLQAVALTANPELALFKPLDSYARSALFTLIPAWGATIVFAFMARLTSSPGKKFLVLSSILLLLSFIPDYAAPFEYKTFLASSVAAFLHLMAAVIIVAVILTSYRKHIRAN